MYLSNKSKGSFIGSIWLSAIISNFRLYGTGIWCAPANNSKSYWALNEKCECCGTPHNPRNKNESVSNEHDCVRVWLTLTHCSLNGTDTSNVLHTNAQDVMRCAQTHNIYWNAFEQLKSYTHRHSSVLVESVVKTAIFSKFQVCFIRSSMSLCLSWSTMAFFV